MERTMKNWNQRQEKKNLTARYRGVALMQQSTYDNTSLTPEGYHDQTPMKDITMQGQRQEHIQQKKKKMTTFLEPFNVVVKDEPTTDMSDKKQSEFSEFNGPVDRFTNLTTENCMNPNELKEVIGNIMHEFKRTNDTYKDKEKVEQSSNNMMDVLTYSCVNNCYYVHININEYCYCQLSITIFTYEGGKCLLDIQELCGEHFTFSQFFECFKTSLRNAKIISSPNLSQTFFDSYGLDMDISLDAL